MKRVNFKSMLAVLVVFGLSFVFAKSPNDSIPGFYVEGRFLKDKNDDTVIIKGLNYTAIWMDPQGTMIEEMAKTGSNAIRIVWTTGGSSAGLDTLITRVVRNGMIPIPELHDLTGKDLSELPTVLNYWTRSDVLKVLLKHKEYLILNIANEVGGTANDSATFVNAYAAAVDTLRAHGLHMPLMIDADKWGQNIDQLQRSAAPLTALDPDKNLIFSIHTWWPYAYYSNPGQMMIDEFKESADLGVPLVIGEFSKISPNCKDSIPHDTLLVEAEKNQIGWMAWAWMHGNNDGNGNNCYDMDMTDDGTYATLHDGTNYDAWAYDVVKGHQYSIEKTAIRLQWIVDGDYTTGEIVTNAGEEIIMNGTFDSDLGSWEEGFWGGSATASATNGEAVINITDAGSDPWDLQFSQGLAISEGVTYVLKFDAKTDVARDMQVLVKNPNPYKGYLDETVSLTTSMKTYSFEFTPDEDNAAAQLAFQLGAIGTGSISFDNVSLVQKGSNTSLAPSTSAVADVLVRSPSGLNVIVPDSKWSLTLTNLQGRQVWELTGSGAEGLIAVPAQYLAEGVGVLSLKNGGTMQSWIIKKSHK